MTEKLHERLAALSAVLEKIEMKASSKNDGQLDPLALAKVLLAVDAMTTKLAKLEEQLQAGLFPAEQETA
jgi:hypothetical protein